jgi:hypothetical protein
VYVNPEAGASQVRFYLDNPSASGTPLLTENNAPWDFAGGTGTAANPYDTKKLSNGSHSITASISLTSGRTAVPRPPSRSTTDGHRDPRGDRYRHDAADGNAYQAAHGNLAEQLQQPGQQVVRPVQRQRAQWAGGERQHLRFRQP